MPGKEPKTKPMSDQDVRILVAHMVDDSTAFISEQLANDREKATKYYNGDPFGNEEEGRSQVVSTDVRDKVQQMLPSYMRVFHGGERALEFRPRAGMSDDMEAREKTDLIDFIYNEDNPGFMNSHAVFKDALTRKLGFMKWWYDESVNSEEQEYTELTADELDVLNADPDVEVMEITGKVPPDPVNGVPEELFNAKIHRTIDDSRILVSTLPPEEVKWNRNARSFKGDARLVCHDREVMVSDLVALGHDEKELLKVAGTGDNDSSVTGERSARRFDGLDDRDEEDAQDISTVPIRYCEAWVLLDKDNTGVAMLYKVDLAGRSLSMLLECNGVSHLPIEAFAFDPEPHTMVGLSVYDYMKDIQEVKSAVVRGTLDSLSLALFPNTAFNERTVNLADLMNTEIGHAIRVDGDPGASLMEFSHRFVGGDTLPVLDKYDQISEERMGISKASRGLAADQLQSSTKVAVSNTLTKAQERQEITARLFAESFKNVFQGIAQMTVEHRMPKRVIRLRNKRTVQVDPRAWNTNFDIRINVGIGIGLPEDRIAFLKETAAEQSAVVSQLGPSNPLVSLRQLRNTKALLAEFYGYDPDMFWKEITEEQQAMMDKTASEQDQNDIDPNTQLLADAENNKTKVAMQKNVADAESKRQELELRAKEIALTDDRERDKIAAELAVQLKKIEVENQVKIGTAELTAEVNAAREVIRSDTQVDVALINAQGRPNDEGTN